MVKPCKEIDTVWTLNWNEQILEEKESRMKDPTTCLLLDTTGSLVKSFEEILNSAEQPEVLILKQRQLRPKSTRMHQFIFRHLVSRLRKEHNGFLIQQH